MDGNRLALVNIYLFLFVGQAKRANSVGFEAEGFGEKLYIVFSSERKGVRRVL